jgi:hypothetical protein
MTIPRCLARIPRHLGLVFAMLSLLGCSPSQRPPLGLVSGIVTLDGEALANANVRFTPAGPGRTSLGTTDAAGRYTLLYLRDIPGANVDQHTVRITTASEDNGGRELLPTRYHSSSQLEAQVSPGTNRLNFALRSPGP